MGRYDGPNFSAEGESVVSVWAATVPWDAIPDDYWLYDMNASDEDPWNPFSADFGFGHDDDDFVESYYDAPDLKIVSIGELIAPLSYASSFVDDVIQRAKDIRFEKSSYVFLIYNFKYDPTVTGKERSQYLRFIGAFRYEVNKG